MATIDKRSNGRWRVGVNEYSTLLKPSRRKFDAERWARDTEILTEKVVLINSF